MYTQHVDTVMDDNVHTHGCMEVFLTTNSRPLELTAWTSLFLMSN